MAVDHRLSLVSFSDIDGRTHMHSAHQMQLSAK